MSSQVAYMQRDLHSPMSNGSPTLASKAPKPKSPPSMDQASEDDEQPRGRRRSREPEDDGDVRMTDGDAEGDDDNGKGGNRSRKRRRSRKGLDKKFPCPFDGCTKSYSRAEHLHRHELNHNPKRRYYCDYPGCTRDFVRQDLCARHRERHNARGSQLQKKDAYFQNAANAAAANIKRESLNADPSLGPSSLSEHKSPTHYGKFTSPIDVKPPIEVKHSIDSKMPLSPTSNTSSNTMIGSGPIQHDGQARMSYPGTINRSNSDASDLGHRSWDPGNKSRSMTMSSTDSVPQRSGSMTSLGAGGYPKSPPPHQMNQFSRPSARTASGGSRGMIPQHGGYPNHVSQSQNMSSHHPHQQMDSNAGGLFNMSHNQAPYHISQNFAPTPPLSLPPPSYNTLSPQPTARPPSNMMMHADTMSSAGIDQALAASVANVGMTDALMNSYMPVFGGEGYNRSPYVIPDYYAVWFSNFMDPSAAISNYYIDDATFQQQPMPTQHTMSITSMLDTSPPEALLSENRRSDLLEIIDTFDARDGPMRPVAKTNLLRGDRDDDSHVLSLGMMQTYISAFWHHFHPQLPILHKPTFAADKCEKLLLLAIMAIGASCLDKEYPDALTQEGADLAQIISHHLRWDIFNHSDFGPPAKLWIFQALLLLEIFEKMFSTRTLHERAHIHHATTITLMRRGSSLNARPNYESPPSVKDEKHGMGSESSNHNSGTNTPDKQWNTWINNEATRRAAFAAFIMDSTHATMFGHGAVMVAHEMRLPLPCDELLWSATSAIEIGRIESSLQANGIKPTMFLEGLQKTLSGEPVRTNSFGRTVLMAGLLSINWHMNQREQAITSMGPESGIRSRFKWRGHVTKAFDLWKADFDKALVDPEHGSTSLNFANNFSNTSTAGGLHDENVFEGRTVFHHLAHMAMHVDIVDCQIFAGAKRLLGRTIPDQESKSATRRMRDEWAPTARARDATFYSLQFLTQVLMPSEPGAPEYNAREDFLLNRPWVLYFAALVTWSYGFALEGKILPGPPPLTTPEEMRADMQRYLATVGGLSSPDDLQRVSGRNRCVGLLMVIEDMFKRTRWELLREAAKLLGNCVEMLVSHT